MVSRNQLIIVTAIVFLGLMGPISYFFQPGATEPAETQTTTTPTSTGYLTPVNALSGSSTAVIEFKEPRLSATAYSDFANVADIEATVLAIPGVKSVEITKEDNPGGEGLYQFTFDVGMNHGSDGMKVMYLLSRRVTSIEFSEFSQLATIILPTTITLTSITGAEEEITTVDAAVTALVFPYAEEGQEYEFSITSKESGAMKQILALMRASAPDYPVTTEEFDVKATVNSVNSYGLEAEVPQGVDVNSTLLSEELGAQAFYIPPMTNDSNATGFLQIMSDHRIDHASVPGTVVSEFSLSDITIPDTVGNYSTADFASLPDRKMPADAEPGDVVDSVVTLSVLFGEVDSVNVIAASLQ
jgi:hypothetical protein